jgi:hypothetical protein
MTKLMRGIDGRFAPGLLCVLLCAQVMVAFALPTN